MPVLLSKTLVRLYLNTTRNVTSLKCISHTPWMFRRNNNDKFSKIKAASMSNDINQSNSKSKQKVLVLTGPTAVGKTKISLSLAEQLNGEIISADSVQVYKELDIGSDKISVNERRGIPHHLIDVLSPDEEFSAGHFYEKARAAVEDILSRGRTPIVVGGTGFYLRWFILGKPSTPPASRASEEAATKALETAYEDLKTSLGRDLTPSEEWSAGVKLIADLGDEESAFRLRGEVNNWYRMLRVVDILLQSPGKTLSQLNLDEAAPLEYDFRCYFLSRPRAELYRRIDSRVEDIVANGLLYEAGNVLLKRGLGPNVNCATKAIGYRQALEFLEKGRDDVEGKVFTDAGLAQLIREIQAASRQLCQKQLNWFRDDALFRWIDATNSDESEIVHTIISLWNQESHQGGILANGGRLSKEEKQEMRKYVSKIEKMVPGSEEVKRALKEARDVVNH